MLRLAFPLLLVLLSGCYSNQSYQNAYDNYASKIDSDVQNEYMTYAEGEQLKLQYLNAVNAQAQNDYAMRQQRTQNFLNQRSTHKNCYTYGNNTNCRTR